MIIQNSEGERNNERQLAFLWGHEKGRMKNPSGRGPQKTNPGRGDEDTVAYHDKDDDMVVSRQELLDSLAQWNLVTA